MNAKNEKDKPKKEVNRDGDYQDETMGRPGRYSQPDELDVR
jgi:hypothetical protein